ncbi:hypothetical protein CN301_04630 [Bacillus cereus]|nr:hypothetical protein CN301_04630 [Bacillus cereus]
MYKQIDAAILGDRKKGKISFTVIKIQINNLYQSIHSGAFSFDMLINHKSVFRVLLELMLLEEKSLI